MALVFVSHSHLDDTFGLQLIGDLKRRLGESAVWYDASGGLHGGDEWWRTIVAAITSHDIFLVILTPAAVASDWVSREMEIAYYQHVKQNKRLLPILLQPCTLPTHWELIQSLNFTDSSRYQQNLILLLGEIVRAVPSASRPSSVATTTNVPTLVVDQMHRGDHITISDAIASARPGTRILVHPGLYREGLVIDKPLEIIGDGDRNDIIIEAVGANVILFQSTVGRVANLTLRQTGGDDWYSVDVAYGRLDLEDCDITSQSLACVAIHDAYARVRRNSIHDGNSGGIYVYDQGQGVIEDNEIFGNTFAGIEIETDSNPSVSRNRIHDGKECGIYINNQGQGVIENNDIYNNIEAGITIKTGGNPNVLHNRITRNGYQAIWVYDEGEGVFIDNDLRGNTMGAWDIDPDCIPNVQRSNNQE